MKLLVTIPYCTKDSALVKDLLDWMFELQPKYSGYSCLLVADHEVPQSDKLDIQNRAKKCFDFAETMIVRVPPERQNWPDGPNILFSSAARQIHEAYRLPWLWLEPDALPLRTGWLSTLARDYDNSPKRFMGTLIPSDGQPNVPAVHLSGCSIYAPDTWLGIETLMKNATKPFDMLLAPYFVPRAAHNPHMQHYWGTQELAPTFRDAVTPLDPKNVLTLDFIKPDAVLFHRNKDGTLLSLLRQNLTKTTAVAEPATEVPSAPPKRRGRPPKQEPVELTQ